MGWRHDYVEFWKQNGAEAVRLYGALGSIGAVAKAIGRGKDATSRYLKLHCQIRPVNEVIRDSWTEEKRSTFGARVSRYWIEKGRRCPWMYGARNPNWNGGSVLLSKNIRNSRRYDRWRREVYARDGYKCVRCGIGGRLNANHVVAFSLLLRENGIRSMEDAEKCAALWSVSNGETLCVPCHKKTDNYAGKALKKKVASA